MNINATSLFSMNLRDTNYISRIHFVALNQKYVFEEKNKRIEKHSALKDNVSVFSNINKKWKLKLVSCEMYEPVSIIVRLLLKLVIQAR